MANQRMALLSKHPILAIHRLRFIPISVGRKYNKLLSRQQYALPRQAFSPVDQQSILHRDGLYDFSSSAFDFLCWFWHLRISIRFTLFHRHIVLLCGNLLSSIQPFCGKFNLQTRSNAFLPSKNSRAALCNPSVTISQRCLDAKPSSSSKAKAIK